MDCAPSKTTNSVTVIVAASVTAFVVMLALVFLLVTQRQRILAELAQIRVNRVKRG